MSEDITPEASLESNDLWETAPSALDPELVKTSERLVALSEQTFKSKLSSETPPEETSDPRIQELETHKQYLLRRNAGLVARVAELEAANLRLQEQLSALKRAEQARIPWYKRLFQ